MNAGKKPSVDTSEIVELREDISHSPYSSPDMAPVPADRRVWGAKDLAVLWISMAACVTTYTLASTMIDQGFNWSQAIFIIFLANCVVLVPMILNAHAGTRYGISFPVYCRASFGILGANIPALLRAFVACGWFGIQTWIGGEAIRAMLGVWSPWMNDAPPIANLGISAPQLGCFLFFWLINMAVVWAGIDSIRVLLNIKAPLLIVLGLLLLAWAYRAAGGFGPMLSQSSQFAAGGPKEGLFWPAFAMALTANVSYWATLSLNIPDFSRYARSQRDQMLGQALGLPTTMALYAFIGVAVTSATMVIYGAPIWDPVKLLHKFENPFILVPAMLALTLATLATNIAANIVSPANDFAHLWPKRISFRLGGLITGLIGIAIQPWHLVANPEKYIDTWLGGISMLLGSCGGVLIADYYAIRGTKLDLAGLYKKHGPYWYVGGVNPLAPAALLVGIVPCLPGFLAKAGFLAVPEFWRHIYTYAWFVSFGLSFAAYWLFMNTVRPKSQR